MKKFLLSLFKKKSKEKSIEDVTKELIKNNNILLNQWRKLQ